MKRGTGLVLLLALLVLSTGYAQNGPETDQARPPKYSDASLKGTYVFSDRYSGAIGTFDFDGKGNYTGGSFPPGQEIFGCLASFSGTYTIKPDGSGTGTFKCQNISNSITIVAAQSGTSFVISGGNASNIAVKR